MITEQIFYTLPFSKDLRQLIKIIFSNLWFWIMMKLLTFIIKDSSVSKDICILLGNHKLGFCDYVTTEQVLKISLFQLTFSSTDFTTSWRELGEMRSLSLSLILFKNLRRQKQLLVSALDSSRVKSEGILSCLWGSIFEYIEHWETSVNSLSPNTALN